MLYCLYGEMGSPRKGAYDRDVGSKADSSAFKRGAAIKNEEVIIETPQGKKVRYSAKGMKMRTSCKLSSFKKNLYLPNVCSLFIFRVDLIEALIPFLGDQLQYFDMELTTKDAVTNDYKVANITNTVQAFDLERSKLTWLNEDKDYKAVWQVDHLVFRDDACMGGLQIAREKYDISTVIITDKLKHWFKEHGVTGLYYLCDCQVGPWFRLEYFPPLD